MNTKLFIVMSVFILFALIGGLIFVGLEDPIEREKVDLNNEDYELDIYVGSDPSSSQNVDVDKALEDLNDIDEKEYTAQDILSSFFGLIKNKEYYAAASLISMEQYNQYFLSDVTNVETVESKINSFGEIITKKGKLKEVRLASPISRPGKKTIDTLIEFEDGSHIKYIFTLIQQVDLHTGQRHWFIDVDIHDLIMEIKG
jgi:hypothetical protein